LPSSARIQRAKEKVFLRETRMPKLPDMSAAAVKKRQVLTLARKAEKAKEPPPVHVVKIRMAKPR
jgi:hypothetical protein